MAKLSNEEIIASLKEMSIIELNDLVKAIEEEFGVTAAAPVAVAAAPVEEDGPAKGPSEVSVVITNVGQTKVAVYKAVQSLTGLGLMEAKKLVDASPAVIKEHISPAEADTLKAALVEAGAEVEIK